MFFYWFRLLSYTRYQVCDNLGTTVSLPLTLPSSLLFHVILGFLFAVLLLSLSPLAILSCLFYFFTVLFVKIFCCCRGRNVFANQPNITRKKNNRQTNQLFNQINQRERSISRLQRATNQQTKSINRSINQPTNQSGAPTVSHLLAA